MKKFVMFVLLIVGTLTSWAYDVEVDGIYYNLIVKAKAAEVTWGDAEYEGEINIPEKITNNGVTYSVTSIKSYAFHDDLELVSVTIPNTVKTIEEYAFDNCFRN